MPLELLRKRSFAGLDIGQHAIRVAEVERTGQGYALTRYGQIATPKDAIKDGMVVDTQSVADAIKQLMRESHVSAGTVNIAVGGGTVVVRTVKMPVMNEATLRKSIKLEAGRYLPSSVEDSYIAFEIIGKTEENQMEVLLVAAPKDVVDSRIQACTLAGLDVESVDVETFAAYRAVVETDTEHEWHEKTLAIIDLGASKTSISVVVNGHFVMTRSITQGGQLLTDALKQYFKLDEDQAEAGKAVLNLGELIEDKPKENPPLRVIQPHVDDLIREIRRSLNYFQSQQQSSPDTSEKGVEMLLLTGGAARLPALDSYASHKLTIPTTSVGVFANPRFQGPMAEQLGDGQEIAVVTGLAMRSLAGGKHKAA